MKEITIDVDCKYTTTYIWPNDWAVNLRRYRNWAAKTVLNKETGNEDRSYLNLS